MKYLNKSEKAKTIEFKSYQAKIVQPGAVINFSENKYNNLKDKNLKNKGFVLIKNSEYKKFMQTNEYKKLVNLRKTNDYKAEEIEPNKSTVVHRKKTSKKNQ